MVSTAALGIDGQYLLERKDNDSTNTDPSKAGISLTNRALAKEELEEIGTHRSSEDYRKDKTQASEMGKSSWTYRLKDSTIETPLRRLQPHRRRRRYLRRLPKHRLPVPLQPLFRPFGRMGSNRRLTRTEPLKTIKRTN